MTQRTEAFDWQALHSRLGDLAEQLRHGEALPAAQETALLRERSEAWSRAPSAKGEGGLEVLAFTLGDDVYAIGLSYVDEAAPLKQVTPLPGTPGFVRGIASVRGRIVSVVDLRALFALPQRGLSDRNHLLILRSDEMEFGLLAGRVLGVYTLPPGSIRTGLAGVSGLRRKLLLGIGDADWQVLDGERLLAEPALRINDND